MSQPKLDILMATYNGEAYISQQIYSLQQQTFTDWRLLIHDDGSTDRTIEIIHELAATDQRICLIEDGLCFHSAGRNFMHLLSLSTAPFISFCDEDDIWLQDKLSTQMEAIQAEDNNIPQCVYCNAYVYNVKARQPIGGISILNIVKDLHDILFANGGIQGCAMIINDKLREKCLLFKGRIAMHDHLITLVNALFGHFTYIPRRLFLYRRYTGAVTGATDRSLLQRTTGFLRRRKPILESSHLDSILDVYQFYTEELSPEIKETFDHFLRFLNRSRWTNAIWVFKDRFRLFGKSSLLAVKVLLRPIR